MRHKYAGDVYAMLSDAQEQIRELARRSFQILGRGCVWVKFPKPPPDESSVVHVRMVYRSLESLYTSKADGVLISAVETYDQNTQVVIFSTDPSGLDRAWKWPLEANTHPSMMPALESFTERHQRCKNNENSLTFHVRFPPELPEECVLTVECACGRRIVAPGLRAEGTATVIACRQTGIQVTETYKSEEVAAAPREGIIANV